MKIGIALSGSHMGACAAANLLGQLEKIGLGAEMLSTCCLPSVPALLYAAGWTQEEISPVIEGFLQTCAAEDLDSAIDYVSSRLAAPQLRSTKSIAIHAVNLPDGGIVSFTNDYSLYSQQLRTFPLEDSYDALSATISMVDGLRSYRYLDQQLCDYSTWYGCPIYPLRMAGMDRILSVSFLPRIPRTPYEVLAKKIISATALWADAHLSLEFDDRLHTLDHYLDAVTHQLDRRATALIETLAK